MHHRNGPGRAQGRLESLVRRIGAGLALAACSGIAAAAAGEPPALLGIPVEFILFALTLFGVALFHHYTLQVALTGLAAIALYKLAFTGFKTGPGIAGFAAHMHHEWVILPTFCACWWASRCCRTISRRAMCRRFCRDSCRTTGRAASRCSP